MDSKRVLTDGRARTLHKTVCTACGKDIWRAKDQIVLFTNHYCSRKCQGAHRSRIVKGICAYCGKPVERSRAQFKRSKNGKMFCSHSCAAKTHNVLREKENHPNWNGGSASYRTRALEYHGKECQNPQCPTRSIINTPVKMLDVHHIDGDRNDNNDLDNLIVLCVWCHAMVTRKIQTVGSMLADIDQG